MKQEWQNVDDSSICQSVDISLLYYLLYSVFAIFHTKFLNRKEQHFQSK